MTKVSGLFHKLHTDPVITTMMGKKVKAFRPDHEYYLNYYQLYRLEDFKGKSARIDLGFELNADWVDGSFLIDLEIVSTQPLDLQTMKFTSKNENLFHEILTLQVSKLDKVIASDVEIEEFINRIGERLIELLTLIRSTPPAT